MRIYQDRTLESCGPGPSAANRHGRVHQPFSKTGPFARNLNMQPHRLRGTMTEAQVSAAGRAADFAQSEVDHLFEDNSHVRHRSVYRDQTDRLVLVKGSPSSRLLDNAVLISTVGQDKAGRPLKVLSPEMQAIFAGLGGEISFQRSPPPVG